MPNKKQKGNHYRKLYSELRDISAFSFKFDLRHRDDSLFTPSQKAQITRAASQLRELKQLTGGMPVQILKPRHLPNETDKQYRKRIRQYQKSESNNAPLLNVVAVPTVANEKVHFTKNGIVKTKQRKNSKSVIKEWRYKIEGDDILMLFDNPHHLLEMYLDHHLSLHPEHNKKDLLVGLTANGYPWKLAPVKRLSYLGGEIYKDIMKYHVIDGDNGENVVGHVIVRKLTIGSVKNG